MAAASTEGRYFQRKYPPRYGSRTAIVGIRVQKMKGERVCDGV